MTGEDQELPAPQSRKRPHSEVEKEDSLPVPVDSPNSQELNHHVVSSESDPNKVVSSPVAINAPEKETPQRHVFIHLVKKDCFLIIYYLDLFIISDPPSRNSLLSTLPLRRMAARRRQVRGVSQQQPPMGRRGQRSQTVPATVELLS